MSGGSCDLRGLAGRAGLDTAEELLEPLVEIVADPATDADDHALRAVPRVEVGDERVARRALDRLPGAEDVPPERLVGVEQPVVDVPDVALRRVEVDVHLLEDHALLLLDLGFVEAGREEHVGEHVERDVARLRAAADVVAGQLLPGERVELAADRIDLGRDRPRGRPLLRALEEHVLGEVGDPLRLGAVSYREPAASMTKHDTEPTCGKGAVTTRTPFPRVVFSKIATPAMV